MKAQEIVLTGERRHDIQGGGGRGQRRTEEMRCGVMAVFLLAAVMALAAGEEAGSGKELTFEEIKTGILEHRASIDSMRASYTISYTETNWGHHKSEDGRWVMSDSAEGEYEWAIEGTRRENEGKDYSAKRYLRSREPERSVQETVMAFDGEVTRELEFRSGGGAPQGRIGERMDWWRFHWGGEVIPDLTYSVLTVPWESALEEGRLEITGTEVIGGRKCYVLEGRVLVLKQVNFVGNSVRVWIDPSRGFATVKQESYRPKTGEIDGFRSFEALEMKKVVGGIWIPVRVLFRHGKEIVIRDVRVNDDIPDDLFTLDFPAGAEIYDEESGLRYRIGRRGLTILWNKVEDAYQWASRRTVPLLIVAVALASITVGLVVLRLARRRKAS